MSKEQLLLEIVKLIFQLFEYIVLLITGLIGGLWGYSKYVLERGVVPHVQLNLECNRLGCQDNKHLLEILMHVKNVGPSPLVVHDISLRLLYLDKNDKKLDLFSDDQENRYGRVKFRHSYTKEVVTANTKEVVSANSEALSDISILKHRTFVQPGVDQVYTVIAALPESATFVLTRAKVDYHAKKKTTDTQVSEEPNPSGETQTGTDQKMSTGRKERTIPERIFKLSKDLGLVRHELKNLTEPHTIERAFSLQPNDFPLS